MVVYDFHQRLFAHRPKELLEIHRVQFEFHLLAGDKNLVHVLLQRHQRTGLNVLIAPVLDEILDCLPSPREPLHFVENDHRLATNEMYAEVCLQKHEELIKIMELVLKKLFDRLIGTGEINNQRMRVFLPDKLLHDITLADTTRTLDHERVLSRPFRLPIQHF